MTKLNTSMFDNQDNKDNKHIIDGLMDDIEDAINKIHHDLQPKINLQLIKDIKSINKILRFVIINVLLLNIITIGLLIFNMIK